MDPREVYGGTGAKMTDIRDISDETKWRLAAEFAARMPALYDRAFRSTVGKQYDGIEEEIWMELSRTAAGIVRELSLPTRNAYEIARSVRAIMIILFGPSWKSEALELPEDGAVIIVKRCPLLDHNVSESCSMECTFHRCLALTLSTVPLLNKKYSARFVRTICTGDRQCEVRIEIDTQPDAK